ncbi:MAG TPA: amylo-alpha-1,6-glucosidase, partial [Dehalococcoidia bacterium]|nr:amylo-alpha-1,6-glucosidase [Dehalococcoidia bacterium]
ITSNPGQALWTGIVSAGHARAIVKTLMSDAMFSGWGIRTLAEGEAAYNPIDYQVGSVWPHDNALIAAGLKRYGFDEEFERVFSAIFQAATQFRHYQLPEVFAGFSRQQYSQPVHYPVACSPQAWASGALPLLLATALGLQPDAPAQRLHVVRPALPEWLASLRIRGVRVGEAAVDLHYRRTDQGTLVAVLNKQGEVQVSIEY